MRIPIVNVSRLITIIRLAHMWACIWDTTAPTDEFPSNAGIIWELLYPELDCTKGAGASTNLPKVIK